MPADYTIRSFRPADLTDMYLVFSDSFSDYPVPFKLSKEQFVRKFVQKLKIDFTLSLGAFHGDAVTGFIFSTVNYYEQKLTAYNGGTGVRPRHRGKGIVKALYDHMLPLLARREVKQCVLEVLTTNVRAIKAYENIGFVKSKYLKCYKLESEFLLGRTPNIPVEFIKSLEPDWYQYEKFYDYYPSFLDSRLMINENLANEEIIEVRTDRRLIGCAIYQPALGRISQIAIDPKFRGMGVGHSLVHYIYNHSQQKALTMININENAQDTVSFFEALGFDNQLDQFEMVLTL